VKALHEIFGVGGAVLERLIARRLYAKLQLDYKERQGYGLVQYVEEAKAKLRGRN